MDDTLPDQPTLPNQQPVPRQDPLIGTVLDGRYKILKLLGQGGMGKVYLAHQLATERKVAVKTMLAPDEDKDSELLKFFRHEMKALGKVNHAYVAQVYDATTAGNTFYMALEYIEGETLRDRLKRDCRLGVGDAVHVLCKVCEGLQAAHDMDIIHRDIKPENIMITSDPDGSAGVKILDFGLAILEKMSALENCTAWGEFAGTPGYMSPEQAMSK
jgi:serine/threonine-protein kinase